MFEEYLSILCRLPPLSYIDILYSKASREKRLALKKSYCLETWEYYLRDREALRIVFMADHLNLVDFIDKMGTYGDLVLLCDVIDSQRELIVMITNYQHMKSIFSQLTSKNNIRPFVCDSYWECVLFVAQRLLICVSRVRDPIGKWTLPTIEEIVEENMRIFRGIISERVDYFCDMHGKESVFKEFRKKLDAIEV